MSFRELWAKPLVRKCFLILAMTHVAQHFTGSFVVCNLLLILIEKLSFNSHRSFSLVI